jgi:hypothetical protein
MAPYNRVPFGNTQQTSSEALPNYNGLPHSDIRSLLLSTRSKCEAQQATTNHIRTLGHSRPCEPYFEWINTLVCVAANGASVRAYPPEKIDRLMRWRPREARRRRPTSKRAGLLKGRSSVVLTPTTNPVEGYRTPLNSQTLATSRPWQSREVSVGSALAGTTTRPPRLRSSSPCGANGGL